ncbi:type II toxin-antitoxin system ParD family antitoxin [Tritonibacter mobilis]|uniref:Uncharacterized protein n=1 Tax=Tritonibacter mobilis F1926 TaxID=1265309 RepID=A0A1B1A0W6_9RHOB|nr:type II toxin-antitoxin system ParD family antitoxin [Tritonibacter mobilis]ANP40212.1 hypothetical protein K529_005475 [Tritonibacter mobilis F1926]KJZ25416.1 hypothetical protein TW79_07130 [Tritonibacter mobilis]
MNFSLGKRWEDYVSQQVKSGVFNNASEVMRDALRRQEESFLKLEQLRAEVHKGLSSIERGDYRKISQDEIEEKALQQRSDT